MNVGSKWQGIGLTQLEIENKFDGFYVYIHINKKSNKVIYCGKGCRRRAISFNRKPYYDDYLKNEIEVRIIARFNKNEQDLALAYEKEIIEGFKYIGLCQYNLNEFHEGKKKIEGESDEMAIDTEVTYEIDSLDCYSYCNEFDIHKDVKFENVKLHKMELNTIKDLEYRNNVDSFMSNLSKMTYEEVKSMYDFAQQNLSDENINISLTNAYRLVIKHLKKYFK